jgi:hypothetical protein
MRPASDDEHVDWCIDGDGLLLSERWTLNGALLRRTTATAVDLDPPDDSAFAPPEGLAVEPSPAGAATRQALALDELPDVGDLGYWEAGDPPLGFEHDSRARVVTASALTGVPDVQDIAFVDVYRRGVDLVVVELRETAVAGPAPTGVEQVDAGDLGTAEVRVSERGAQLDVVAGPWLVTIRATTSVADLTTFARSLAPVSGP